jgi:hypothetical protein
MEIAAPQTRIAAPQMEIGAPQTRIAAPQMEFGAPETRIGAPQMEFGAPFSKTALYEDGMQKITSLSSKRGQNVDEM